MAEDTVENLRAELNALRAEFEEFKAYAKPVIDGHQPDPNARQPLPPHSPMALEALQRR